MKQKRKRSRKVKGIKSNWKEYTPTKPLKTDAKIEPRIDLIVNEFDKSEWTW